ncbi:unnamed protein product, partial [Ectocarpus sp. 12 AP-2014]
GRCEQKRRNRRVHLCTYDPSSLTPRSFVWFKRRISLSGSPCGYFQLSAEFCDQLILSRPWFSCKLSIAPLALFERGRHIVSGNITRPTPQLPWKTTPANTRAGRARELPLRCCVKPLTWERTISLKRERVSDPADRPKKMHCTIIEH